VSRPLNSTPPPGDRTPPPILDVEQHNQEIHENQRHWDRKPELRAIYAEFYQQIAQYLPPASAGTVLECGSGIGNLKSALPHAVTSDLFPNPWLDRQENIYTLSDGNDSLAGVVLFDVFHHLRYPGLGLTELHRVLQPGGCAVIMEPAAGLLGRIFLGLFHHEPLALGAPIAWQPSTDFDPTNVDYYAAQGNAWRIFHPRNPERPKLNGWSAPKVHYLPAVPWIMTGGFRGPTLNRGPLRYLWRAIDSILSLAPRLFASRMIVVLEKSS
tara:strand:- start:16452 stop:17258 length:807 start_codon:yes stop_codon:yes gene_type:complete